MIWVPKESDACQILTSFVLSLPPRGREEKPPGPQGDEGGLMTLWATQQQREEPGAECGFNYLWLYTL